MAGEDLEICFDNPALAGTSITVEISNGEGLTESVEITLDTDGHGCATWHVPATGWEIVNLNSGTSLEHSLPVVPGGGV